MISWMQIIDIGHTAVMLPTAGAIAAWLIAGRAWKLASCWCFIVLLGLGLVASSKVVFLGWGLAIPSIGFKALSGHAWRATAIIPVLFFVLLQAAPERWRRRGFALGVLLGIGLGSLLVIFRFHTASEVIASSILGIGAGLLFVRASEILPAPTVNRLTLALSLLAFVVIWDLKPSSINHHLVDVALYLSGRDQTYQWKPRVDICTVHPPGAGRG